MLVIAIFFSCENLILYSRQENFKKVNFKKSYIFSLHCEAIYTFVFDAHTNIVNSLCYFTVQFTCRLVLCSR